MDKPGLTSNPNICLAMQAGAQFHKKGPYIVR